MDFYRSSSSSSSVSSDGSLKLLQRLQNERIQQALEKKREKEAMKANETPEEKRARRLREKLEKERKRKERMGWDNEYQHYTNTDNPFGDGNLTSTFVWSKKLDKEGLKNISHEEIEVRNRHKQLENKMELEKVNFFLNIVIAITIYLLITYETCELNGRYFIYINICVNK